MKKYNLEVTEKQLQVIQLATELYMRIGICQFDRVIDMHLQKANVDSLDEIRKHLDVVKQLLTGYDSNSGPGIRNDNVSETAKIACDINQVVRHHLAWERKPEGDIMVDFNTPMSILDIPLPNLSVVKK